MELKMNHLREVATELNKVLELDPPIKLKVGVTKEDFLEEILEAATLITAKDKISEETREILSDIGAEVPESETPTPAPKAQKKKETKPVKEEGKKNKIVATKEKRISATQRVQEIVCDDPTISVDGIIKIMGKEGSFSITSDTVAIYRRETLRIINYLTQAGKMHS